MYGVDGILDVIAFDECLCTFSDKVFPVASNDLGVDGFSSENLLFSECKRNVVKIRNTLISTFLYK